MPTLLIEILHGISIEGAFPDAVLDAAYSAQLRARHAVLPLRWAAVDGAWPPNGDWDIDPMTGQVTGTALDAGSHTITVQLTDGAGSVARRTFVWRIAAAPLLISGHLGDGTVGDVVSYTYTTSGGVAPRACVIRSGALPDGLSMDSAGHVTGTRTAGGVASWIVRVTDAVGTPADLPDACETAWPALTITGAFGAATTIGQPLTGSPAITGGDGDYTLSGDPYSGTRPPGVSVSIVSGHLVASGNTTAIGTYTWTERVLSGDGQHRDLVCAVDVALPAITSRYWRIWITETENSGAGSGYINCDVIALHANAGDGINLVPVVGGTCTESSSYSAIYRSDRAWMNTLVDAGNSTGSFWHSNSQAPPFWAALDCGVGKSISARELSMRGTNIPTRMPSKFKVQISNDGSTWTDVVSFTGVSGWNNGLKKSFSLI